MEVTKDGIELKDYKDMPGLIWKSQIIEHDYVATCAGIDDFSFLWFLKNVCTHRDTLSHENNRFEGERFKSLQSVIGHLMSNAYDPAYQKAIILSDSALTPNPEGGTGKGILCNAIGKLRKTTRVDGQSIYFKSQFALQELGLDTQVVWFDDVKPKFDFGSLFSCITEQYSFEKKHQQKVKFRPDTNPKTVICTNYAVKGIGASHARRRFEFELLNYYNATFTPETEFLGLFFETWNENEWNLFYTLMFSCVQAYLANNSRILPYESETLERKKLVSELGREFIEYADQLDRDKALPMADVYDAFVGELSDIQKRSFSKKQFGLNLKRYCEHTGLKLEKDTQGNIKTYRLNRVSV